MGKRLYIGKNKTGKWKGFFTPFWSAKKPTEESHGDRFSVCEGPFKSAQEADDRASYLTGGRSAYRT